MTQPHLSSHAIGAAGELLVQYHLLKFGIESARLTTAEEIDLAIFLPRGPHRRRQSDKTIATIQVRTTTKPTPAGNRGDLTLGWHFPHSCGADWLACVDLSSDSVWLLTLEQARDEAQEQGPGGTRVLSWYLDPDQAPESSKNQDEMQRFSIDTVLAGLTGDPRAQ